MKKLLLLISLFISFSSFCQNDAVRTKVTQVANQLEPKVIAWRRDYHEHPELGNNEFRTAGPENVQIRAAVTGAEDFSFYQEKIPGIFFFLGGMPKSKDPKTAPSHHTPDFYIDESGLTLGVKALLI